MILLINVIIISDFKLPVFIHFGFLGVKCKQPEPVIFEGRHHTAFPTWDHLSGDRQKQWEWLCWLSEKLFEKFSEKNIENKADSQPQTKNRDSMTTSNSFEGYQIRNAQGS